MQRTMHASANGIPKASDMTHPLATGELGLQQDTRMAVGVQERLRKDHQVLGENPFGDQVQR